MLKLLKTPPNKGDKRIVRRFAIFPIYEYKLSDGKYYFCWWEYYYLSQQYMKITIPAEFGTTEDILKWINIDRWIE